MNHGTTSCYRNQKCRCAACKEANRVYNASYRKTHREERVAYQESHREEIAVTAAVWREAHPEQCKGYVSNRQVAHDEYLAQFLTPCEHCGATEDVGWHHAEPSTKLYSVANMRSKPKKVIDEELAKCICLCRSCHARHHMLERLSASK